MSLRQRIPPIIENDNKKEQGKAGNGGKIGYFDFHGLSSRRSCSLTQPKSFLRYEWATYSLASDSRDYICLHIYLFSPVYAHHGTGDRVLRTICAIDNFALEYDRNGTNFCDRAKNLRFDDSWNTHYIFIRHFEYSLDSSISLFFQQR